MPKMSFEGSALRCLRSIAGIGFSDHMSNVQVGNRVLGAGSKNNLSRRMKLS